MVISKSSPEVNAPSCWRDWTIVTEPVPARLLACNDDDQTRYGVLDIPRLVQGHGSPKFSLILLLSRNPTAGEETIRPLLISSYLGLELDYGLPPAVAEQLRAQPLFARNAQLSLRSSTGETLITVRLSAPLLKGALHTHLTRDQTCSVLDALAGLPSLLKLHARIEFRASAPSRSFQISLSSAELWDRFHAVAPDGQVSEEAFRHVFDGLRLPAEAFKPFCHLCKSLLGVTPGEDPLRRRPAPSSTLLTDQAFLRHVDLQCSLEDVLGNALTHADQEACIRLMGPSGSLEGGPWFKTLKRTSRPSAGGSLGMAAMVVGNKIQTVASMLQPTSQAADTGHLLNSQAIRIQENTAFPGISHYQLPQGLFVTPTVSATSLPLIGDLNAPLLFDKIDPGLRWFLPAIALIQPVPSQAWDASPFLFEFEHIGTTSLGRPAIRANLRFTLSLSRSAAASASLGDSDRLRVRMVEPEQPSVILSVPYVEETTGTLKRASYRGITLRSGNELRVTIELLNDAARMAYGSLSTVGFQTEKSRLEISYQFTGYERILTRPQLIAGGKISNAELLLRSRGDSDSIHVSTGGRELVFRPGELIKGPHAQTLGGRLTTSLDALTLPMKLEYIQRTFIREQRLDVFFPCDQLGNFYREKRTSATVAIGCSEAFRLGHTVTRTYQEMPDLNRPSFRVFRNLQQPGRFLVLPTAYEITRYEPGTADREYRPALIVYAALDANQPENSRIRFEAMLGPSITLYHYEDLRRRLLTEAQSPVLEFPNMLARDTTFHWNLTEIPPVEAVTSVTPQSFHVSLVTDITSALLLKTLIQNTGLNGEAHFTFEDESVLKATLSIHLGQIVGPWSAGPLHTLRNGANIRLTNRVETSMAVKDVYFFNDASTPTHLPVEKQLAPGSSLDLIAPGAFTSVYADVTVVSDGPRTFEEVRATIEEVQCNVIFVDLINYENYGLVGIDVEARLRDVPGNYRVVMKERRGSIDFLLPLTTYLVARIVEYRITKRFTSKPSETTGWLAWDLETASNIVSITWEAIAT